MSLLFWKRTRGRKTEKQTHTYRFQRLFTYKFLEFRDLKSYHKIPIKCIYISKGAVEMVLQAWHLSPGLMNSVHPEDLLGRRREATAVDCPLASIHILQHMGTSHHTQKLKNFLRPAAPPKIPVLPPAPHPLPHLLSHLSTCGEKQPQAKQFRLRHTPEYYTPYSCRLFETYILF